MIFDWFKKSDIDFIDRGNAVAHDPKICVKRAVDVEPFFREDQKNITSEYQFPKCPGMLDYSRIGYIIPAWSHIHIKANSAGIVTLYNTYERLKMSNQEVVKKPLVPATPFDSNIIKGMFPEPEKFPVMLYNFNTPWNIRCRKGLSVILMPAFYHCRHLEDLFVVPGIVDYSSPFQTINFIAGPRKAKEIHILPGEPLIHCIPIPTETIVATYGKRADYKTDIVDTAFDPYRIVKQWYAKYYKVPKKYKLFSRNKEKYEIFR